MVSEREEFEDTKGVIKISISKNRQHNGQPKKFKRTKNDLPKIEFKLMWRKNIFDIYVTEYGTALTTILPILFLYLNTVIVTAGTFEP